MISGASSGKALSYAFRWRAHTTLFNQTIRTYTKKPKFPPASPRSKVPAASTNLKPSSETPKSSNSKHRSYLFFKITAALGVTGTLLYFTNDTFKNKVKHAYLISERIGVVTVATARCFSIYKLVLDKEYNSKEERHDALSDAHSKAAHITLKALEKNGGVFIKLGQHVSALTYLLPKEWTQTMIPLQDRCPESSLEDIEELFRQDTGKSLNDVFSEFDPKPIGVASLAQVHIATMRETGEKVAVKVQHLSLAEFVPIDVYMTQTVFNLMYKVFPEYPMTWLGDELQNSIYVELDFCNEAKNAEKTAEYFTPYTSITALRIPKIVSVDKRILIMECISGARLDDFKYLQDNHILAAQVSSCLSHIFNTMIFSPGAGLHCDPHGGNLAIRALPRGENNGHNFEIVLYDHGLYRYIPLQMKRDYAHFWLAILDNDVPSMRKYAEKVAGIKGERKFQIFAAAITGRDPENAMNYDISTARSENEINKIQDRLQQEEGVLEDLMEILSSMPRIVLLILKTNDLTRVLDENLQHALGMERTFLILANYCARTVYEEAAENNTKARLKWSISWMYHSIGNWLAFERRRSALFIYDLVLLFHVFKSRFLSLN